MKDYIIIFVKYFCLVVINFAKYLCLVYLIVSLLYFVLLNIID